MAFIDITITKKYGVFIPCEKCGVEEAQESIMFDSYPVRLCYQCRREFQFITKDNRECQALILAKSAAADGNKLESERIEAWKLYMDIQKGLKSFIDDWLVASSSSESHRHQ